MHFDHWVYENIVDFTNVHSSALSSNFSLPDVDHFVPIRYHLPNETAAIKLLHWFGHMLHFQVDYGWH